MRPTGDPLRTCIDEAAIFVAAQPGAVARLREEHHRRPDGRCAGCGSALVHWPCVFVAIADTALQQAAARRPARHLGSV